VHGHGAGGGEVADLVEGGQDDPVHGAEPERADVGLAQHGRHPAHVVRVGMRQHHEVQRPHPASPQPGGRRVVAAGVDQDARPAGLDQQGIPLPDVDGGDREDVTGGPADR
jgi:hypothetical protein